MPEDAAKRRKRYAEDPEYREKIRKEQNEYGKRNRSKINACRRKRYAKPGQKLKERCGKHGISVEEYQRILTRQNNACGICEQPFTCTPCIDHCHKTKRVRGLLCNRCNLGLGNYHDNPDFLRKAADYLDRWEQRVSEGQDRSEIQDREENDMSENDDPTEESKAAGLVRRAILHELHLPFGVDPSPPADWLQAVSRALVLRAGEQRDVQAIKEVFDRIGGKMASESTIGGSTHTARDPSPLRQEGVVRVIRPARQVPAWRGHDL